MRVSFSGTERPRGVRTIPGKSTYLHSLSNAAALCRSDRYVEAALALSTTLLEVKIDQVNHCTYSKNLIV